ncbi:MAG: GNAT family N-acetyltransferase [Cyanobacteriota bacterium]|nr:GNAT family N-acetyltransferase [Cyanobacteriota bacterium]
MEQKTPSLFSGDLSCQRCFGQGHYSAYFLSPAHFRGVASWVGAVRARSYRQVSPHGPAEIDLDGRDDHYWHLLILDHLRGTLAGSLRLALSAWHQPPWDGSCSYLEHCYPGLDLDFRRRGATYAEIGRTFVASPYQRTSPVLLMLLRAMVSIPLATGHPQLLGMVAYNHFQHSPPLRRRFLGELLQPPFRADLTVPPPRHLFPDLPPSAVTAGATRAETLSELERSLEQTFQEPFRVPLLLKKYMAFGNARVVGVSLARDFNQICEILMHCDLAGLLPHQRRVLVVDDLRPVWEDALR